MPQDPQTELQASSIVVDIIPRRFLYSRFTLLFIPLLISIATVYAIRHRPKHILATFPFDFYTIAAYSVARILGISLSVYFHDVWEEAQETTTKRWIARLFEPIILSKSINVFVITDALREHFQRKHDVNSIVLRHPLPHDRYEPKVRTSSSTKEIYHIVYTGNVSYLNVDAVQTLISAVRSIDEIQLQVDIYGGQSSKYLQDVLGIRNEDPVTIQYAPFDRIPEVQQEADLLFVALSFTNMRPFIAETVFPTKFVEYLAAGKPIIVHAPKHSYLASFVEDNQCGYMVTQPDSIELKSAILRLLTLPQLARSYAESSVETAALFYDLKQAKILADSLGIRIRQL